MYDNSSLPKLLAKENISIRHGNYQTPWFDIKNRVLGLPLWKDMGKDVYDLFVGHEVGHALETPYEGWHDSPEKLQGCPRSYINVIEDARIERKVKARYPGLVGPFARAYAKLFDDNFFGTNNLDHTELKLIDKINLQAKVGDHLNLEFNDEEQVFMDRAMKTEDFQEVLQLVKDIVAYDKTQQDDEEEPNTPENNDENDSTDESQDSMQDSMSGGDEESEEENNDQSDQAGDEDQGSEENEDQKREVSNGKEAPEGPTSITDEAFRSNEHKFLDTNEDGTQTLTVSDINKEIRKKIVISYDQLAEERLKQNEFINSYQQSIIDKALENYGPFMKSVKRSVGIAVKEFEMRKAATQWAKATTAKTGVIDVNKLFSYKTNEDIFKQTTRLYDSKNHGMMLLIDYSGSMCDSLPKVLEQVIHLVLFCKQVNIPFEVYAFTTTNRALDTYDLRHQGLLFDGDMDLDNVAMPLLTSSKLKKKDFEESIKNLYVRSQVDGWTSRDIISPHEDYGSTPLNQALVMSHHLIKDFKMKNAIEKMNLVVFSDGEANSLRAFSDNKLRKKKIETQASWRDVNIVVDGKLVKSEGGRSQVTQALLENLRNRYGINCIGFFMADNNRAFNFKVDQIVNTTWAEDARKAAQQEYRKNKCVVKVNALGYNEFYLIKGGNNLSTEDDDFEVSSEQSRGQMANAFKKYSKSKKANKVLMTQFGRCVAQ